MADIRLGGYVIRDGNPTIRVHRSAAYVLPWVDVKIVLTRLAFDLLPTRQNQKYKYNETNNYHELLQYGIHTWNQNLKKGTTTFEKQHPDASVGYVEVWDIFYKAFLDPGSMGAPNATCTDPKGEKCVSSAIGVKDWCFCTNLFSYGRILHILGLRFTIISGGGLPRQCPGKRCLLPININKTWNWTRHLYALFDVAAIRNNPCLIQGP